MLVILNPADKGVPAEFQMSIEYKKLQVLAGIAIRLLRKNKMVNLDVAGTSYSVYKVH